MQPHVWALSGVPVSPFVVVVVSVYWRFSLCYILAKSHPLVARGWAGSAACFSSSVTNWTSPREVASCSGVAPSEFTADTSAPRAVKFILNLYWKKTIKSLQGSKIKDCFIYLQRKFDKIYSNSRQFSKYTLQITW